MASGSNNQPHNVSYDALPVHTDDHGNPGYYHPQPSTDDFQNSGYNTPQHELDAVPLTSGVPAGAAQPRFLGAAAYDSAGFRNSLASSNYTHPGSEYGNSVYALDPTGGYRDDPNASYEHGAIPMSPKEGGRFLTDKNAVYAAPKAKSKRRVLVLGVIAGIILLIAAIAVPVYIFVIKPHSTNNRTSSSSASSSSASSPTSTSKPGKTNLVTGGDGSKITLDNGTTITYANKFGGYWYYDENDPFNNNARAQSWSPALNETFKYGIDQIRGVNLGGWLVTEPFVYVVTPALYQKYSTASPQAVDEWTLCQAMRADTAGGGINQLEDHYKTFITEEDFAEIAGAGLNFVRIPIGYWAIETRDTEQFLPKTSWTYFLKAIKWARKYGIRINLDLHALPGSQNGWNHSGRLGTIGFMNGPMGYVNVQRSLDYIRVIAEFISQPEYKDVVTIFGIINEPQGPTFGKDNLSRFYLEAYRIIRQAGGTGEGNGPYVSIHDGFFPRSDWVDIFPNADRMSIDTHPYLAFNEQSASPLSSFVQTPCTSWGNLVNTSMGAFGLTTAGEWSLAVNDCGLFLNNVGAGTRYEGTYTPGTFPKMGSCTPYTDWQNFDADMKSNFKKLALSTMDALQNYFFWTWKIGPSLESGKVETPAWSYQLGLQNGWMPTNPQDAVGACGNTSPFAPPLKSWQTGGAGVGIPDSVSNALAWPPTSISAAGAVATLPAYTATGPIPTLPAPTFSAKNVNAGNGWNNAKDNTGFNVPIPGCTYLDPWVDPGTAPPAACAGAANRRAPQPTITPPPSL
ncbi:exo-beta-1,3-glucanase [Crepidotus variabilis]|uniref:glucan 1,3-beta-glucosidase n=1 Tax=Crepidotus variabilis TaxID=179855 RepID=A0A9P6ENB6_9AGAR|nr:exo-beta-1,3-glucanase [Crepidotus variabilis]